MKQATVTTFQPGTKRNIELFLLLMAVGIVLLAYLSVGLHVDGQVPLDIVTHGVWLLAMALVFHVVLRIRASYADPIILPIATLLNGIGIVLVYRIDMTSAVKDGSGIKQILWSGLAFVVAIALVWFLRDHRVLRRYTYTLMVAGLVFLLLPLVPVLGLERYGARIWIHVGSYTFQPGEVAKIFLIVFFAGYFVQTRDALSLVGRSFLGMQLPRARDLGPIMVAWLICLAVLFFEKDLGTALLFFGTFVALLYVATERRSWVAIGLSLFGVACYAAYLMFAHLRLRIDTWLHLWDPENADRGGQLRKGLMGMADGGLFGTGLGAGSPNLTPVVKSDFIFTALGEELGMVGAFAVIMLYVILAQRGLRTALGTRDGFGKLLAAGLSFSLVLQVFVIIGGVTRVIPLTGLTTPFLSAGGSSLLANWAIVAIVLRISDHARRPVPEKADTSELEAIPTVVKDS